MRGDKQGTNRPTCGSRVSANAAAAHPEMDVALSVEAVDLDGDALTHRRLVEVKVLGTGQNIPVSKFY